MATYLALQALFDRWEPLELAVVVLILVMLATNNPQVRTLISRIIPRRKGAALDE